VYCVPCGLYVLIISAKTNFYKSILYNFETHNFFKDIITKVVLFFIRKNPLNIYVVLIADFIKFIYILFSDFLDFFYLTIYLMSKGYKKKICTDLIDD